MSDRVFALFMEALLVAEAKCGYKLRGMAFGRQTESLWSDVKRGLCGIASCVSETLSTGLSCNEMEDLYCLLFLDHRVGLT